MRTPRTSALLAAVALVSALALTACGGGDIENEDAAGGEECGTIDMAINPWVGYEASAHVVGYVAETKLGCTVNYKDLDEQVSWQGFGEGEVDVIIENWGHPELQKKYFESKGGDGSAMSAGPNGNEGIIGWYLPPWMAEEYPDITDWKNLDKYSELFQTPESGDKGTLYDGDPGFVTNDEALVKNLDLDYEVVFAGSENALIEGFRKAEENKTPYLGYFYEPQWFLSEVPLVKVELPEYTEGCDADPEEVACDYPLYTLDKIVATDFAESGSPGYELVENFKWTNEDQNEVAKMIASVGMDPEEAAQQWVEDNPDKVEAWLP
jgi:glycine betaine/proline transport system substrate-binding protein